MRIAAVAAVLAALALAPAAAADSFAPVRLSISVAPVARARAPLHITVRVAADPGALDTRSAPLRVRVKLAPECGGTYEYTGGPVLLDARLIPQPTTNRAYTGAVQGAGRPPAYGTFTVCTWLAEEGDDRAFASDQSIQVNVSRACTSAAARYDAARRRHRSRAVLTKARRQAGKACGPGVPL